MELMIRGEVMELVIVFGIMFFVLILVAVIMLKCGAIIMHSENKKRNKCTYEVIGTSKSALRSRAPIQQQGEEKIYYNRIYEYQYGSILYEAISRVSTSGLSSQIKEKKIYINPSNPKEYLIDYNIYRLISVILYGIGAFLIIVAIIIAIVIGVIIL